MKLEDIVQTVTKKTIGTYIDNGYYHITEQQARKLCGGKLPRHGYEKTMRLIDGKPAPSVYSRTTEYIIADTFVSCRTDGLSGRIWSIREG
mgnify:CR=1 FL=1